MSRLLASEPSERNGVLTGNSYALPRVPDRNDSKTVAWRSRPSIRSAKRSFSPPQPLSLYHQTPFEVAYERVARERNLRRLESMFTVADVDRSGNLSLDEFREAFKIDWVKRAFSTLGVQPHQSGVIFQRLVEREADMTQGPSPHPGELSIGGFVDCLGAILGRDGAELELSKLRRQVHKPLPGGNRSQQSPNGGFNAPPRPWGTASTGSIHLWATASGDRRHGGQRASLPTASLGSPIGSGQDVHRTFVQSASAAALHSATASRRRSAGFQP